ncbi:hypothetical protein BC940DRAFT_307793 [Gongronella butleri]|nr:hypothetical protein BC940DRAFT_307793 [Gongronella butleri]
MSVSDIFKKLGKRISPNGSPNGSPSQSTPASPSSSVYEGIDPAIQKKFLNDPMRTTTHPDIVGYYVDPMGTRVTSSSSIDVTNTGA